MRNAHIRFLLIGALVWLSACIEPIEVVTGTQQDTLVVDGTVTSKVNPQTGQRELACTILLSSAEPFNSASGIVVSRPITGAQVYVQDKQGNKWPVPEKTELQNNKVTVIKGNYGFLVSSTESQVGNVFTVFIKLPNGKEYQSQPEVLQAVPPIQELEFIFKEFVEVVKNGAGENVEKKTPAFEVSVTVNDPANAQNAYRWETEGIFQYQTNPPEILPPPASICWSYAGRINKQIEAIDDSRTNGQRIKLPVAVVPFDLQTRYQAIVRQYSLTPKAYEFWRLYRQQQTSVGSITDPAPAQIRGNLFNVKDPSEVVIGYFGTSEVNEKFIIINRSLYGPMPGAPFVVLTRDCRGLYSNSTHIPPFGF
ncbi:DUF4249 domain-containing protein [Rufibacter sp. DG15C]|uniref:DUF4249 domain-containing protein n=1 Tax=Rufibacter sp. DG15C TaxID=1379909 RepID=UPI00082AA617|nr:DUF4249 domain-containing protein [Rufibacter sp. DG15C]